MIFEVLSIFLMSLGCVIMFSASLALLRFPDVYMRLHASAKASTGGTIALLGGLLLRTGLDFISTKIVLVILFILFTSPILSHAIARAAHLRSGMGAEIPFEDVEEKYSVDKEEEKKSGDDTDGD